MFTLLKSDSVSPHDLETILYGLDVETETYSQMLEILGNFERIRRQLEDDNKKLKTYQVSTFEKSSKISLFKKNVMLSIQRGLGEEVLWSFLCNDKSDTDSISEKETSRVDSFILACFSLSENHFQDIKKYDFITGFHRFLEKQTCSFSESLRNKLIRIIANICEGNDKGKIIIGLHINLSHIDLG
ncbi:hypothetical protein BGW36DRAFT_205859 [Talaromyces proteolyticus]|uniref:Uncharacterized protein n=1 Tax=Talaromyces proteolyticus TaxID=1131652 RepID=A0AAD4PZE4_9EURO|nr:uncharacterized protein BGW36DRAFT_205859 [Talaromyces proteolyticus]KAH8695682.1 hypothetical protein BGW36DRAFT_205859 [Talaromyces proteolyticus]